MAAKKKTTAKVKKESDSSDGCQQVLSQYFDLTGDTLEAYVEQCRGISAKMQEGSYSVDQAQQDFQDYVDRTSEYYRELSRIAAEGMSCFAQLPMIFPTAPADGSKR